MTTNRCLLLVAASASLAALAGPAAVHAQVPDPVKLGVLLSLTGGNATYGASGLAGTKLAVDEINKSGGVAGKQIQIVVADDQTDPAKAVAESLRLAEKEKVAVVSGPLTSQIALAVGPTLTQAKIMNISGAGSSALTPALLKYHFSVIAPAHVEAPIMVDYAVDVLKAKTIAWLGDNGAIAKSMLESVREHAKKRGVKLIATQEYAYRGDDVAPQVLALRRAQPDVLLMRPNSGEDHGLIMRTISEINWKPPIVNGGGSAATPGVATKVFPDAYRGTYNLVYKSWTYCPSDAVGQTPLGKFKERLKAANESTYDRLNQNFASQAYDAVYIIKAAIEGAKSTDGAVLTAWLEQNARTITNAVNGQMSASTTSHFLVGTREGMAFTAAPDKPRADGLFLRTVCE